MAKSPEQLREQAQALIKRAKEAEECQKILKRLHVTRAAEAIGRYLLRERPEEVRSLIPSLSDRERRLIESCIAPARVGPIQRLPETDS